MFKKLNKTIKKLDHWDISLIKLSSAAGILFVITIWPAAMELTHKIGPLWFLIAMIIFAIRPMQKYFK